MNRHRIISRLRMTKPPKMLAVILILGTVIGVVYVYLIPPWQHYDEPGNFEYAWLIANRPGLPKPGEYDQGMRREVAASMMEHHFFTDPGFQPNLLSTKEPIWIGVSQLSDPPLYFWIAALPLRLLRFTDITLQLYATRLVSFTLFLLILIAAWGAAGEILPSHHPLRWMIPLSLTLIPGFVDQMTAVNNDAGAVLVFTAFLWTGLRMIRCGINLPRLLANGILIACALHTKSTAYAVVLLEPLILLFGVLRVERGKLAWILIGCSALLFAAGSVINDDAAVWFRNTLQSGATRQPQADAPLGKYVFSLDGVPGDALPEIIQFIPTNLSRQLAGEEVTLGAWIWASQPAQIVSPALFVSEGQRIFAEKIQVSDQAKYFVFHTRLPDVTAQAWVALAPFANPMKSKVSIYYDGLTLLSGNWNSNTVPEFSSTTGQAGAWDGKYFNNLLRNPSAESHWLRIRPQVDQIAMNTYNVQPTDVLNSILDPESNSYYYRATFKNMLQTFWAKFGWQKVYIAGYHPYTFLGLFTLAGFIGAILALFNHRHCLPWKSIFVLAFALIAVWGITLVRGVNSFTGHVYIPPARYAYPAIFPTVGFMLFGWYEIGEIGKNHFHITEKIGKIGYWLFWIALNFLAIYSILKFYHL